jgi:hypothetical protein
MIEPQEIVRDPEDYEETTPWAGKDEETKNAKNKALEVNDEETKNVEKKAFEVKDEEKRNLKKKELEVKDEKVS